MWFKNRKRTIDDPDRKGDMYVDDAAMMKVLSQVAKGETPSLVCTNMTMSQYVAMEQIAHPTLKENGYLDNIRNTRIVTPRAFEGRKRVELAKLELFQRIARQYLDAWHRAQ